MILRPVHQFRRVEFIRFKALESFRLDLGQFNILVGPNNSGKSTILAAFRILAAGMRTAGSRKPEILSGPQGNARGYQVDLSAISVAEENIFYNYDDRQPASVVFRLANKNTLTLYFPKRGVCYLFAQDNTKAITTPTLFKSRFNCPIGFVPILGPVEHNERLYGKDAARLALFNYRAARNFRNIWHHYPEHFETFRDMLRRTWPGMDIDRPVLDTSYEHPVLHMFCPEARIPRELFWAGFGFQVWCQMLTHLVQSSDRALFLIDEPDIYLHSDLQRQLLGLLRNLGPDILIATHSTEIVTEAEPNDVVLIDKRRKSGRRLRDPAELADIFLTLGSNLNPIFTQLAKTRRAVFVEGKDFQVIGRFARRLGLSEVANRTAFAVIPVEGFNPDRIRSLKRGIESTLGEEIAAAAVLDRDFRSADECEGIRLACVEFCDLVIIHNRKEIENFLLVPDALDRAAARRVEERRERTGEIRSYSGSLRTALEAYAAGQKSYVMSQFISAKRSFERGRGSGQQDAAVTRTAVEEFEAAWGSHPQRCLDLVPGKDALSAVNRSLQASHGVSLTPAAVIDAMHVSEIRDEMRDLLKQLATFASSSSPGRKERVRSAEP